MSGVTTARRRTKDEETDLENSKAPLSVPTSALHLHVEGGNATAEFASRGSAHKRMLALQTAAAKIQQRFRQFVRRKRDGGDGVGGGGGGIAGLTAGLTRKLSHSPPSRASETLPNGAKGGGGVGRANGRGGSHPLSHDDDDDGSDDNAADAATNTRLLAQRRKLSAGDGGASSRRTAVSYFSSKFLKCAMLTVSWFGLSTVGAGVKHSTRNFRVIRLIPMNRLL